MSVLVSVLVSVTVCDTVTRYLSQQPISLILEAGFSTKDHDRNHSVDVPPLLDSLDRSVTGPRWETPEQGPAPGSGASHSRNHPANANKQLPACRCGDVVGSLARVSCSRPVFTPCTRDGNLLTITCATSVLIAVGPCCSNWTSVILK